MYDDITIFITRALLYYVKRKKISGVEDLSYSMTSGTKPRGRALVSQKWIYDHHYSHYCCKGGSYWTKSCVISTYGNKTIA